jgi:hypothetical protein
MTPMDYADVPRSGGTGTESKIVARCFLLVAICIGGFATLHFFYGPALDQRYFQRHASDQLVLGKTPAQVIAILGKPLADSSMNIGERELTYRHGEAYLGILFENGVAARTSRWTH